MRFIYIFLISTFFISCSSIPKDYLTTNDICHTKDPIFKITKEEMTFDVGKYGKALEKKDLILVDNKKSKNRYYKYPDGEITNKQTNKQLNIGKWIDYFSNGKIKSSTFIYLNGSKEIYKETYYNQQGKIEKIIDHDKGYKICWAEAIAIVKKIAKKDIKKYKIDAFYLLRTDLNEFPNSNPEWDVSMKGNEEYNEKKYSKKGGKIYVIDGLTGELLKIKAVRMVYDD